MRYVGNIHGYECWIAGTWTPEQLKWLAENPPADEQQQPEQDTTTELEGEGK